MKNMGMLCNMMDRCMMFGEIIGQIDAAFAPVDKKLLLANTIPNQVKTHVNSFGPALFDSIVGDTTRGAIVGL